MTTIPTFAECAAVPPEKRTALERFICEWTRPHAAPIGGLRGALLAVVKEERKERDALAAAREDTRKVRDEWCDEYTKARDERDTLAAENARLRKDAERYRWLKADADTEDSSHHILFETVADEWDAAIDAALAKEPTT